MKGMGRRFQVIQGGLCVALQLAPLIRQGLLSAPVQHMPKTESGQIMQGFLSPVRQQVLQQRLIAGRRFLSARILRSGDVKGSIDGGNLGFSQQNDISVTHGAPPRQE